MKIKRGLIKFNPIAASILLSMPMVTYASNISMVNGTLTTANGVPVININGANSNGISHNVYDKLNVGKEGVIFNNSQNGANTTLAGQIGGNSNLSSGTAKVILNEVTSRNKSELNGMMEVAGDKAHVIIANPNGITCDGCGFINAEKGTLTTGTPDIVNGELKGYSVSGGTVTVKGNGLTSGSPTAILARSVAINGNISVGGSIDVVAGNNYVNTNNQVTGTVRASGSRNTYGVDVSQLGGMYADRISLVSTESGVGVRNLGVIAAANGGIQIDTNGQLLNSNARIESNGVISLKTNGRLNNVTGQIVSDSIISIDTNKNAIDNSRSGKIMSGSDVYISSAAFDNTNGKVTAGNMLALNTNGATLTNSGKGTNVGIEAAIVALETGTLNNSGGQIHGYYVGTSSTSVNNSKGIIESYGNIDIVSSGAVNNSGGLIRAATGRVMIDASKSTVTNTSTKSADTSSSDSLGIIAGDGGIEISANQLNNSGGQIASSGNVGILTNAALNNNSGKIMADRNVSIKAASMVNSQGSTTAKGDINIETSGAITNNIGAFSSEEGAINISARSVDNSRGLMMAEDINVTTTGNFDNSRALMVARNNLMLNIGGALNNQRGTGFGSAAGLYFGMPNQDGGIIANGSADITAKSVNNNNSRIIAENGALNMNVAGAFTNNNSWLISGGGNSSIKANSLTNNNSTIHSGGNMTIDVGSLSMSSSGNIIDNNATGIISALGDLVLNIGSNFTNNGWITGGTKVTVNTTGTLTNRNTIHSNNEVNVYGERGVTNSKDIVAGNKLTVGSAATVANSGNMFTEGTATITAKTVNNSNSSAVLGGRQGLDLQANSVTNRGIIVGL